MKYLLLILLIFVSGCYITPSSHDDCVSGCLRYGECKDTFEYKSCFIGSLFCTAYDLATDECRAVCYNECKPQ